MRDCIITLITAVIVGVISAGCFSHCKSVDQCTTIVNVDSIQQANDSLQNILNFKIKSYQKSNDSLQAVINDIQIDINNYQSYTDSIANELLVANYKLERIKYYNSIATGTQIKYLRGWINRVLKD